MEFGARPVREAEGTLLAHAAAIGRRRLKKGHRLTAEDVVALLALGIETVIVAATGADDVPENEAAQLLAEALARPLLRAGNAGTGRCSLYPDRAGLLLVDAEAVHRFNAVDEAITLATVAPFEVVRPGRIAATVKIIPFAAPRAAVERCLDLARDDILRIAPFRPLRVALLQTRLTGQKPALMADTVEVTRAKLGDMGSILVGHRECGHTAAAIAEALLGIAGDLRPDVALVLGASAIVDRRDVVPAAIVAAGGSLVHFGMPVDPGNLTLVARLGPMHVIGLPGSARSPRMHGSDFVLQRIAAGIEVRAADVMRMGVGGLLKEIPSRPMPRARASKPPEKPPRIAAIVLAAGRSTRMGHANKLLADIDGVPLLRRAVESVAQAAPAEIVVVVGHERAQVEAALSGYPVRFVFNPGYADGMGTSLAAGAAALAPGLDAALVCLGDMPAVAPGLIERLAAAFAPRQGRDIVVPVRGGRRGNPVLFGSRHFAALAALAGDVGARGLLQSNASAVVELPVGDEGPFLDLDTPEALAEYRARAADRSECGRH